MVEIFKTKIADHVTKRDDVFSSQKKYSTSNCKSNLNVYKVSVGQQSLQSDSRNNSILNIIIIGEKQTFVHVKNYLSVFEWFSSCFLLFHSVP